MIRQAVKCNGTPADKQNPFRSSPSGATGKHGTIEKTTL